MINEIAIQLRADYAQSFISSGVFLRQRRRYNQQQRGQRFPHVQN